MSEVMFCIVSIFGMMLIPVAFMALNCRLKSGKR